MSDDRAGDNVLTHLDTQGRAQMVDVGSKDTTDRRAVAVAAVRMRAETFDRLTRGDVPKGDVWATARIAGIQAAKRTPELIPLCHAIALTKVSVRFEPEAEHSIVRIEAEARARDRTGVEMEALVAASVAALTLYDMLKAIDREMTIETVRLDEKHGGKSGSFVRGPR